MCERELETEQNCNILTPSLMAISVSFPFSRIAQPEARGPSSLLGAGFLYHILCSISMIEHSRLSKNNVNKVNSVWRQSVSRLYNHQIKWLLRRGKPLSTVVLSIIGSVTSIYIFVWVCLNVHCVFIILYIYIYIHKSSQPEQDVIQGQYFSGV